MRGHFILLLPILCLFIATTAFAEGVETTTNVGTTTLVSKQYVDDGLQYVYDQIQDPIEYNADGVLVNIDDNKKVDLTVPSEGSYMVKDGAWQEVQISGDWGD